MAKNEGVAKMRFDTQGYDRGIDSAAKKLREFGKNGVAALTPMLGSWGKLVPAIGAAVGGMETFNKVINTCQTYADSFAAAQQVAKDSVDSFFYAISTGDFTVMEAGLDSLISKSAEYAAYLDQLANTQMSYSAIQAEANEKYQKAVTQMKSLKKGTEEYNAALKDAQDAVSEMSSGAQYVQQDLVNVLKGAVAKDSSLDASQITWESIGNAIKANATKWGREGGIEEAKAAYEAYKKERAENFNKYGDTRSYSTTSYGAVIESGSAGNPMKYAAGVQALNDKYKDQIVMFTALEKWGDDYLNQMTSQYNQYYAMSSAIEGYNQRLAKLGKTEEKVTGGGGTKDKWAFTQALRADNQVQGTGIEAKGIIGLGDVQIGEATKAIFAQQEAWQATQANMQMYYKQLQEQTEETVDAISGIGGAFQTVGDLIGGQAGTIVENMGKTLTAIAALIPALQAVSMAEGTEKAISSSKSWIEAIAATAAVVASVVATFQSLPAFSNGGIVPGNDHNDGVLARLSSGEIVLNQGQQAMLFKMLNGSGTTASNGGEIKVRIENNQLVGTLNNASKRSAYIAQ